MTPTAHLHHFYFVSECYFHKRDADNGRAMTVALSRYSIKSVISPKDANIVVTSRAISAALNALARST